MGDIGYPIVELLHRLGESVVVITDQAGEERRQTAEALGVRVLLGDARNDRFLLEAGLASARVLIAATDKDLVNIEGTRGWTTPCCGPDWPGSGRWWRRPATTR